MGYSSGNVYPQNSCLLDIRSWEDVMGEQAGKLCLGSLHRRFVSMHAMSPGTSGGLPIRPVRPSDRAASPGTYPSPESSTVGRSYGTSTQAATGTRSIQPAARSGGIRAQNCCREGTSAAAAKRSAPAVAGVPALAVPAPATSKITRSVSKSTTTTMIPSLAKAAGGGNNYLDSSKPNADLADKTDFAPNTSMIPPTLPPPVGGYGAELSTWRADMKRTWVKSMLT